MRRLRSALKQSSILATAIMIIAAGVPRSLCACVSPRSESAGSVSTTPCCCRDGCQTRAAGTHHKCPCCQTHATKSRTPADSSAPCKRVAAAPVVFTSSKSEPQTGQENPALVCPALQTGSVAWTVVAAAIDGDQQIHLAAPPPDLITLLQHFNI